MTSRTLRHALLGLLLTAASSQAQVIYSEEFDGTGNGYNADSASALVGENDWVDFGNRITTDFSGNEGYFTAAGGTESVLAGASNSNDPQIRSDFSPGLNQDDVGRIELRIRVDSELDNDYDNNDTINNASITLLWGSASYGNPGATNVGGTNTSFGNADQITLQSDGWHLFVWNDVGGLGVGTVNSLRIDPTNGAGLNGASFEIDYLTIEQSTVTPPVQLELDPGSAIGGEFTLREEWNWNNNGDQEGWTAGANGLFTITGVSGGLLTGDSSGGDPQLLSPAFEVFDVETGRFVIEIGMTTDPGDTSTKRLFWALNGGAFSGAQSATLPSVPNDGGSHVVRITFTDEINGPITGLRYDPSTIAGITSNLDYIRIYSEGPEITPPVTSLDGGALATDFPPLDSWILQREWHWLVDGDLDGWTAVNFDVVTDGMIQSSVVTGEAETGDPQWSSPSIAINAPANGRILVELGLESDFAGVDSHELFWGDNSGGPAPERSVDLPTLPDDSSAHVVRILFDNDINATLSQLRYDPAETAGIFANIDYIRIYTDGVPLSLDLNITAFTYDPSTGDAEITLKGSASTVYTFVSADDLNFAASTPITLTGATVGSLSGGGVETDGSGNATVQANIGMDPKNFLRAE